MVSLNRVSIAFHTNEAIVFRHPIMYLASSSECELGVIWRLEERLGTRV